MKDLKQQLYKFCREYIEKSMQEIESSIADRREAIANETKSSMGDKYETTREMLQQDINMNMARLNQVKNDEAALNTIDPNQSSEAISHGSVVHTNNGRFYIAISAGNTSIDGNKYYIISPSSPIGLQLKGRKEGDDFTLNGKTFIIQEVL
jgi:transcription elongation GreA/GreB family factor